MAKMHAVSRHFRQYLDRPEVVVDSRTSREYSLQDIETQILVYEDRVTGWFLQYGRLLQKHHDAAFVVLQVALAQIEGLEQYRSGKSSNRRSRQFFRAGIKRIFSLTEADALRLNNFYDLVRCGLFHDGMTRAGVGIGNGFDRALDFHDSDIKISPNKFFDAVSADFAAYIAQLKEREPANMELREAFQRAFKRKWDEEYDSGS